MLQYSSSMFRQRITRIQQTLTYTRTSPWHPMDPMAFLAQRCSCNQGALLATGKAFHNPLPRPQQQCAWPPENRSHPVPRHLGCGRLGQSQPASKPSPRSASDKKRLETIRDTKIDEEWWRTRRQILDSQHRSCSTSLARSFWHWSIAGFSSEVSFKRKTV